MDNNNIKNIIIGVLLIGLVSMTVVYATLFQRLNVGGTATLKVTPNPWNALMTGLTWESSDDSVATVSNGNVTAVTDENAKKAMAQLSKLRHCEVHSSILLSSVDINMFKKLGVNLTCEPKYQTSKLYHS